jgi:hypothetical protein
MVFLFTSALDNLKFVKSTNFSLQTLPNVFRIGGYFSPFNSTGHPNFQQAQSLAAFIMAINEINANPSFLPNTKIEFGIAGGNGFLGAIEAGLELTRKKFNGAGVDIIVSAGADEEAFSFSQYLNSLRKIHLETVSMTAQMNQGASFPYKLQTLPDSSFQGNIVLMFYGQFIFF